MKKQFKSLLLVICLVLSVFFIVGCDKTTASTTEPTTKSSETTESSVTTKSSETTSSSETTESSVTTKSSETTSSSETTQSSESTTQSTESTSQTTEHTHEFAGEYQHDETYHWQVCSCSETNKVEHTFGDWTTTATHTADGTKSRECSVCHYVENAADPAIGHDNNLAWSIDETTGEHYQECSCGEILNKGAHVYSGTDGDGNKLYGKTVTKWPTSTEDGEITIKCLTCGDAHTETLKLYTVEQAKQFNEASNDVILIKGVVLGTATTGQSTELLLKDETTNAIIALRDVGSTKVGTSNALLLGNSDTPIAKGDLVQVLCYPKQVTTESYVEKGKIYFNSVVESYGETWASANIMLDHSKSTSFDHSQAIEIDSQEDLASMFNQANAASNAYKLLKLTGTIYAIQYTTSSQNENTNWNRFFFDSTINSLDKQKVEGKYSPCFKDNNVSMMTGKTAAEILFGSKEIATKYGSKSSFTGIIYCIFVGGNDAYSSFDIINLEDVLVGNVQTNDTEHWWVDYNGNVADKATHNFVLTDHEDVTCTVDGYNTYTCSCGKSYTDTIPHSGHDQPTALSNYTYEEVEGEHKHYYTCHCGEKVYTDCTFGDWSSNCDATCLVDGTKTKECTLCNHKETANDEGSKLNHVYGEEHPAVQAVEGTNGNIAYYQCSLCEHYFVLKEGFYVDTEWSAIETIYSHTCSCKENGHHEEVPASCFAPGTLEYYECECGKKYSDSNCETLLTSVEIKQLTHNYGTLIDGQEATCIADGNKAHYHCSQCNHDFELVDENYVDITESVIIPKTGHDEPTSETEYTYEYLLGEHKHYYTCHCGEKVYLDCSFSDWTTKSEATCELNKVEKRVCSVCAQEVTREVASTALIHEYIAYETVAKITDASALIGKKVIFVSGNNVLCSFDNAYESLAKKGDAIVPQARYYVFTIEDAGNGKVALKGENGKYLSIASSGNAAAPSNNTITDNAKYEITITDGIAKIYKPSGTKLWLAFNADGRLYKNSSDTANIELYLYEMHDFTESLQETCTTDGNIGYYTCKNCGAKYWNELGEVVTETSISKTGHDLEVTWEWNGDHTLAYITIYCKREEKNLINKKEVEAVIVDTSSCEQAGTRTCNASYVYDGVTYNIPEYSEAVPAGHNYTMVLSYNTENSKYEVECTCSRCKNVTTEDVSLLSVDQARTHEINNDFFVVRGVVVGAVHNSQRATLIIQDETTGNLFEIIGFEDGVIADSDKNPINTTFKNGDLIEIPVVRSSVVAAGQNDDQKAILKLYNAEVNYAISSCIKEHDKTIIAGKDSGNVVEITTLQEMTEFLTNPGEGEELVTDSSNILKVVHVHDFVSFIRSKTASFVNMVVGIATSNQKINNCSLSFRPGNTDMMVGKTIANALFGSEYSNVAMAELFVGDLYLVYLGGNTGYYQFALMSEDDIVRKDIVKEVAFGAINQQQYEKDATVDISGTQATIKYYQDSKIKKADSVVSLTNEYITSGAIDTSTEGEKTFTVTVEGKTHEYAIEVVGVVKSLVAPTVTTIYYSELTKDGLILKAKNEGSVVDITFGYVVGDAAATPVTLTKEMLSYTGSLAMGSNSLTITYDGVSVAWNVTLVPNTYYAKVTKDTVLKAGDVVIIVASNNNLAAKQKTGDGGTIVKNADASEVLSIDSAAVSVYTLSNSTTGTGNFHLYDSLTSTYLGSTGSNSTTLGYTSKTEANSSWKITVDDDGYAIFTAQGSNSAKYIVYNSSTNKFGRNTTSSQSVYAYVLSTHITVPTE